MILEWVLIGSFENRENFFKMIFPNHQPHPYNDALGYGLDIISKPKLDKEQLIIRLFSLTENRHSISRFHCCDRPTVVFYYPEHSSSPKISNIHSLFQSSYTYLHCIGIERQWPEFEMSLKLFVAALMDTCNRETLDKHALTDDAKIKLKTTLEQIKFENFIIDPQLKFTLLTSNQLLLESLQYRQDLLSEYKTSLAQTVTAAPWYQFNAQRKLCELETRYRTKLHADEELQRHIHNREFFNQKSAIEHPAPKRLVAYTVDIHTGLLDSTQKYRGHPSPTADINYRLQVFESIAKEIANHVNLNAYRAGDLIVVCLPEFFFRGGANGCYFLPETEDRPEKSHYHTRKEFVETNVLAPCETIISKIFNPLIQTYSLSAVVFCCGTIPVAKTKVSQYKVQVDHSPTVKTDNFALVVGHTMHNKSFRKLIDKRYPSRIDYYDLEPTNGNYNVNITGIGQSIPILRGDGSTVIAQPLSRSLHIAKQSTSVARFKPLSLKETPRAPEPAWFSIPGLFSPSRCDKEFTFGVATCLDALYPIFAEADSIDVILAPSAGLSTKAQQYYKGVHNAGFIIRADGSSPIKDSSVGFIVNEKVRHVSPSFPKTDIIQIILPAFQMDPKFFYTKQMGQFVITQRGCCKFSS